jgi:hypothetical protein
MKHCLLFLGLFFSVFSAQAQDAHIEKPTPPWLIPDSSRTASWAVLFTPTERVNLGTQFEFEAPLFKKKPHTRWFVSPTFYHGQLEERRFTVPPLPNRTLNMPHRIRGWRLMAGLRQSLTGEPFYTEHPKPQGYLQLGGGFGWLNRRFQGVGWGVENGVYLPMTSMQTERLYRTELNALLGIRVHTHNGTFFNLFLGVYQQRVWQAPGKNLTNIGWPEREQRFGALMDGWHTNFNAQGLQFRAGVSVGWAKAKGRLRAVPFHFLNDQKRFKLQAEYNSEQSSPIDTLFSTRWAVATSLPDLLIGLFRINIEVPVYEKEENHFNLLFIPIFFSENLARATRGRGLLVGIGHRLKNQPFYAGTKDAQAYLNYYGGIVSFKRRDRVMGQVQEVSYYRIDLGTEFGYRVYGRKNPFIDVFVGIELRTPFRRGEGVVVNEWSPGVFEAHFNGIAPRAGIRLGIFKRKKTDFIIR